MLSDCIDFCMDCVAHSVVRIFPQPWVGRLSWLRCCALMIKRVLIKRLSTHSRSTWAGALRPFHYRPCLTNLVNVTRALWLGLSVGSVIAKSVSTRLALWTHLWSRDHSLATLALMKQIVLISTLWCFLTSCQHTEHVIDIKHRSVSSSSCSSIRCNRQLGESTAIGQVVLFDFKDVCVVFGQVMIQFSVHSVAAF